MRESIKIILIVIIIAAIGWVLYLKRGQIIPIPSASPSPSATETATPRPISDMIRVAAPLPDQTIDVDLASSAKLKLLVAGQARGSWFFEASFPIKIIDGDGKVLLESSIQTQENWMTEDFVPFAQEVIFPPPMTLTGTLILMNDNPSGLPENSLELKIPLRFNIPTTIVKAYFGSETKNPGAMDCSLVYPTTRIVAKTTEVARAALEELLKGPTDAEKNGGDKYYTSIPMGVKIKSLTISKGVAKVDFDSTLEQNVGGSCRVSAIRSQIESTLKQFSTVKSVVISIDGRTEDILQP